MIHEEICTYEMCSLAKEKGYPQHIGNDAYIVENEYDDEYEVGCCYPIQFIPDYLPTITAPTQSLLQRWLREEKTYAISVFWDILSKAYCYEIVKTIGVLEIQVGEKYNYSNPKSFNTYELALEDALKYALENLV